MILLCGGEGLVPATLPVRKLAVRANMHAAVRGRERESPGTCPAVTLDRLWSLIVAHSVVRLDASEDDLDCYWASASTGMESALESSLEHCLDASVYRGYVDRAARTAWDRMTSRRDAVRAFTSTARAQTLPDDVLAHIVDLVARKLCE